MNWRSLRRGFCSAAAAVVVASLPVGAVSVTRTSSDGSFLISTKFSTNNIGGMYTSYRINNNDAVPYDDVWVTLDTFTGGEVVLGSGEDGRYQVGSLAVSETKTAYFYLSATATTATPQSHTLHVHDRRPDLPGAVELHTEVFSFTDVDTSISAASNKVDVVVSGPNPGTVGGIITMTVEGRTGTVGASSTLQFSPAADNGWPATSFRLFSSDITFNEIQGSNCTSTPIPGGNFTEQLQVPWNQTSCYVAVYQFVAMEIQSQPTAVTPLVHVASGTQIKHTDPSGFAGLPPIQPAQNVVTLSKSVAPSSLPVGGTTTYTVTFTNSGSNSGCPPAEPTCNDVTLEDMVDVLPTSPATASYVPGTATFGGSMIADPSITGSTLTWAGSFVVPVGTTTELTYDVTFPAVDGVYANRAVAHVGSFQIDTTLDGMDDAPGIANLTVGTIPSIGVSKAASFTGTGPFAVTLDFYLENFGNVALSNVQVSDDLDGAFGAGNYSITTGPTIVSDPGGGLTVSGTFDGSGDQDLLDAASSSLGVGQTAQLRVVVSVTSPGSYTNTATAGGDPPSGPGNRVTDDSIDGTDPDANNNNDPTDDTGDTPIPLASGSIALVKEVGTDTTTVGGLVGYTIAATNTGVVPLVAIAIEDLIPAGFKYVDGSAFLSRTGPDGMFDTLDDVTAAIAPSGNRPLVFEPIDFAATETVRLRYLLQVGTGVTAGSHVNVAEPSLAGILVGNTASASIEIIDDVLFDRTTVIGKVFHDRDADGWQDAASATGVGLTFLDGMTVLVPQSAEIDGAPSSIDDGTVQIGDLKGRPDATFPVDTASVLLRTSFEGGFPDRVQLTTREGTDVVLALDGGVLENHSSNRARQETAQAFLAERQGPADSPDLFLRITNTGLDEAGLPGVRIVTTEGLILETDHHGRYHLADVDGGRWERGRNFILKVDPATLPPGSWFTTENPRVLRITRGLMSRINFGVALPQQPEPTKDRTETFRATFGFEKGAENLAPDQRTELDRLAERLSDRDIEDLELLAFTEAPTPTIVEEQRDYTLTPHFPPLGVELNGEDRADLDQVIGEWSDASDVRVEVHGHTSDVRIAARSRHIFADNYALSRARAKTVADYLRNGLGLTEDSVIARGHGPDMPVASNETADGRARNRRTELKIYGTFSERRGPADRDEGRRVAQRRSNHVVQELGSRGVATTAPKSDWGGESTEPRVEVRGTYRVQTPAGGVVWAAEDPATARPILNLAAPKEIAGREGHPSGAVPFVVYLNYADFIRRWELLVSSDTHNTAEAFAIASGQGAPPQRIEWDGRLPAHPERTSPSWSYRLRVFDDEGRFDETRPRRFSIVPEASSSIDHLSADIFGVDNLGHRSIPVQGSRVRVHGTSFEPRSSLQIDGHRVPVDEVGDFAFETIKPVGKHQIAVADEGGEDWVRAVPVEVTGKYFFLVGIADLTAGANDLSGNLQPLAGDEHYDGDVFVDGRFAMYLKGKVKGKYLVTARLDTGEDELDELFDNIDDEDPRRLFRQLDPDRYYPVYGDESTTLEDAPSQGKLYVRVDWDKSNALWGNYATGFTGTEFAQYNRTLYGARFERRSRSTTTAGEDRMQVKAFASPAQALAGHNRFEATGGSLYYLRDTEIVLGSEKVAAEVVDRDSGRVVERVEMVRGRDYEIDEFQGRVLLTRPLSQVTAQAEPSIVKDRPLDGNRVFLLVDYEYRPTGFVSGDTSYGVRGQGWAGEHVSIGGTAVQEDRAGQDYQLLGADLVLRGAPGSYVKLEYAQSESSQNTAGWISNDGGLTFSAQSVGGVVRDGEAYGVEARAELGALTGGKSQAEMATWYRHRSAGFSSARVDTGIETDEYGAEAVWSAGDRLSFAARGAVIDQQGLRTDSSFGFQTRYRLDDTWQVSGEARYVREETLLTDGHGMLAAVRADYELSEQVQLFGTAQATLDSDTDYADNDLLSVGSRVRLGQSFDLTAEASAGDRGQALQLGAEHNLGGVHQLYGTYTLSTDRSDALHDGWTIGQKTALSDQVSVFVENQFARTSRQAGLGRVFGVDYRPADRWHLRLSVQSSDLEQVAGPDIERDIVSITAGHSGERTRWASKLEFRTEEGGVDRTQWLTTNRVDHRVDASLSVFGKFSMSFVDDDILGRDDARFVEGSLGLAYRPVGNDRWNVLSRYTYLVDLPTGGQVPLRTDQRSQVFSADALYRVTRRWELGAKLARREGEMRADRGSGVWFGTDASLAALRARYHLVHKWDGLAEYRRLWSDEADDSKAGFLLGVDRPLREHLRLGIGYNFTDFTDDLTNLDYDGSGWFLNVVGTY